MGSTLKGDCPVSILATLTLTPWIKAKRLAIYPGFFYGFCREKKVFCRIRVIYLEDFGFFSCLTLKKSTWDEQTVLVFLLNYGFPVAF